jgi:hypothetical protein
MGNTLGGYSGVTSILHPEAVPPRIRCIMQKPSNLRNDCVLACARLPDKQVCWEDKVLLARRFWMKYRLSISSMAFDPSSNVDWALGRILAV